MSAKALFSKFDTLTDKRDPKKSTHILAEVMFMSVCAILCGANDWNSIRLFAEHKEDWFRQHLTLPVGIPVAITFNRIFAALEPEEFRQIFIQWIKEVLTGLELSESRIVALEKKQEVDLACGEIETAHPGYLGSQDTFVNSSLNCPLFNSLRCPVFIRNSLTCFHRLSSLLS